MSDRERERNDASRRTFIAGIGAAGLAGVAGCVGEDGDVASGGSNTGGNGGSSGSDGEHAASFSDFDPDNPNESLPQPTSVLFDHDLEFGSVEDFTEAETIDEPRYGGDVWERPEDESEWLNPDTLQYTFGAGEDSVQIYADALEPLMENIEAETGKEVEYRGLDSHAAMTEAMRSDRLHVARAGVGNAPFIVNLAGAVPFGMMVGDHAGYRMWSIARTGNEDVNSVEDFEGGVIAHKTETSNSGHFAPMALLPEEFGVDPGEDYEIRFPGQHEDSARGVLFGDYDGANVSATSYKRIVPDEIDPADLKALWMSPPFPNAPAVYNHKLHPDIVEGVKRAHLDYDYEGTSIEEVGGRYRWIEIDYATHYDIVLAFQEAQNIEYEQ